MDKNILLVQSEEKKALKKDLVSFHKSFRLVFNAEVIAHTGIQKGWYADIRSVNKDKRTIVIQFYEDKQDSHNRKVGDPLFSKVCEYLAVGTTQLIWEYELCPFGAFEYHYFSASRVMAIHF